MRRQIGGICLGIVAAAVAAVPSSGQTTESLPGEAARQAAYGRALAEIGRSGLRSLLSASGNLGDLQNRAGSYRIAAQMERARAGALEGRIAALDDALAEPGLPLAERDALRGLREAAAVELATVPRYEAAYSATTAQAEALVPLGFAGGGPMFLMIRGRAHARWGGADELTVFSEAVSAGPVFVGSSYRWILSPGLSLGRTDVDIGAFDGRSGATSLGPRLDVGGILGEGWSAAIQLAHRWSRGGSTIVRPGPGGGTEVTSRGWSGATSAKAELKGRFHVARPAGRLAVRPRIGAFFVSAYTPSRTNSLGEEGTGPFGERESLAALRAGATLETGLGAFRPSIYLGFERELAGETATLIDDPEALLASVGASWSWTRGRRLSAEYALLRGLHGRRGVSELTLVLILDG